MNWIGREVQPTKMLLRRRGGPRLKYHTAEQRKAARKRSRLEAYAREKAELQAAAAGRAAAGMTDFAPRPRPSREALREAERIKHTSHPTIVGELMGDPLPGRSALDKRNNVDNNSVYLLVGGASTIAISDLGTSKYELSSPISIFIQQEDVDEYIARFGEAELSRSGETPQDAVDWLKSSIVTLYGVLKNKAPEQLGPLPARQLRVLGDYIVEKPHSKT